MKSQSHKKWIWTKTKANSVDLERSTGDSKKPF
jgi:hypothetical protein